MSTQHETHQTDDEKSISSMGNNVENMDENKLDSPLDAMANASPATESLSPDDNETDNPEQSADTTPATQHATENSTAVPEIQDDKFDADATLEYVKQLQKRLKSTLEAGQLKKCISLYEQCQVRLKKLEALDHQPAERKKIQKKLNHANAEIQNLKKWRHWGMNQARQGLIDQLTVLKDSEEHPREIYLKLKSIKDQWHRWNQTGDFPHQKLRETFSEAYNVAFEPCKSFFSEQKAIRKSNKKIRKRICAELETLFEATDWQHNPDWQHIGETIRHAKKQWKTAVPLNKKDWDATNARFDEVMNQFNPYLEREREKGVARREELIRKAHALDQESIKNAIDKAKLYQMEWKKVTIRTRKKKENELWKEFKSACDRQFERRSDLRGKKERQRQENQSLRQQLLHEIEAINQLSLPEIKAASSTVAEIRRRWKQTIGESRHQTSTTESQFNNEVAKFHQASKQANRLETEQLFQLLEKKAEICNALEQSRPVTDVDAVLAEHRRQWESITTSCGAHDAAMRQRFDVACQMLESTQGVDATEIEQNYLTKQNICLRLEVLTDLDSPPEFAKQRMQYNVERLNAAMTKQSVSSDPEHEIDELLVQYWLTGAVPAEFHDSISRRFDRIRSAMLKANALH